jgi:hypothetical protein
LALKYLKDVGIDAKLNQKEYGAYIATCFYGKFDSLTYGPQTPFLEPDNFLFGQYSPGELKNQSHVNDPAVADMLIRQRRVRVAPASRTARVVAATDRACLSARGGSASRSRTPKGPTTAAASVPPPAPECAADGVKRSATPPV